MASADAVITAESNILNWSLVNTTGTRCYKQNHLHSFIEICCKLFASSTSLFMFNKSYSKLTVVDRSE